MPSSGSSRSASDRRAAQREEIRRQRMAELRRQRRIRTIVIAAITVVALLILAGIGYAIYRNSRPAQQEATVAPQGVSGSYYSLGAASGKPVVDMYLDYMCPYCGQFHQANGSDLDSLVKNQQITLHLHTRTFLDANSSTGDYSTRAANAAACVVDEKPDALLDFTDLLFTHQPKEGSAGLTNAQLTTYAKQAGASDAVSSCISSKKHAGWLHDVVEKEAKTTDKQGTPLITINGTKYDDWATPGTLAPAVAKAAGTSASDGGQG